jgi:hypothetical protein
MTVTLDRRLVRLPPLSGGRQTAGATSGPLAVQTHWANCVSTVFTLVRSEADSRERCNSADVHTFLFQCWRLASCLGPLWQRCGRMHPW